MAELVGAFAASHGPLIAREWEVLPDGPKQALETAFRRTGDRPEGTRTGRRGHGLARPLGQFLHQQPADVLYRRRRGA